MRLLIMMLLSSTLFFSCKKDEAKPSEELINELLFKYPQLGLTPTGKKKEFTLTRYIKDNNWSAEFELYEASNYAGILLIRKNNLSYSIPLFDNEFPEYWSSDSTLPKHYKKRLNTTFDKELKAANKKLGLTRNSFLYFRYLFMQILGLLEDSYPDPCTEDYGFPMQILYHGSFRIIETQHSRDSITLQGERIFGID